MKKERLREIYDYLRSKGIIHTKKDLAERTGYSQETISRAFKGVEKYLTDDFFKRLNNSFEDIFNKDWLLTGEGEMLKKEDMYADSINPNIQRNRIPFYDDIITVGGFNGTVADLQPVMAPSEYIDTGDWFKEATAAIRHYGESMTEYPPGCILALKELKERRLVVWGRDYLIETNEYRVTKRVQRGKSEEYIKARSTNEETYSDGQLIHEHLDIAWNDISRIFLVLGYVVKKNGGTMVYSNSKK
jgi:hypothetical protein